MVKIYTKILQIYPHLPWNLNFILKFHGKITPNIFLKKTKIGCVCAFGASLQEIQSSKKVKIGIRENLPPFSSQVNGGSEGFEVSLAKEIGAKLVESDGAIDLVSI